ncbi:hemopexin repeat-containing protein [Candidatus Nitrospira neomarina]|uniref:Hemopexin repeat-containing protein n=1 Tax=Candidatus Nitrospira neomarina TaxID=3020899 RepID=A0AA96GI64_9BACT|nr:hemopexin repeat-containing protein [Candidatus Nitrospira neomarina]WNM62346.1 hemopexin repeat-containing protein [Candidatus Nitrospira neomarina]
MRMSREIFLSTLCGMLIAVSFCGTVDVWAQLTGSGKLVPVVWNNGKVYFFQGSEYARYDIAQDRADSDDGSGNAYPRPIRNIWPGLFEENMDAAVFWPAPPPGGAEIKTVAYFFKGHQFMRYDVDADRADAADGAGRAYPQPISLKWPGIWTDRVDAVVVWPVPRSGRTVAYFFRDDQYIRFDVKRHRADPGYPKPIAGNWPNFKFPGGIDGAVAWPTEIEGKSVVYFFKGNQYMRYDVVADRADDQSGGGFGYPAPVAGNWPGLLTTPGGTDVLAAFARECDQAIGVSVPDFDVDSPLGTTVPTDHLTPATATYPDGTCDRPNVLNGKCDRGSRFRVLINTPDAYVVAHARKMGLSQGQYGDVAIIQHNKVNGKTCFYQGALEEGFHLSHDGKVKAPSKGVGNPAFWMTPSQIVNSKFPCVSCHDNGPIIRSPYLAQISGPNQLPGTGDITFNSDPEPYSFVGADFASWKAYKVEVSDNQCNGCHRMGVNNVSNTGIVGNNGTALDLGIKATARSQDNKHPHSATSPIWMTPGQITFDQGTADAALAIKQCAEQFRPGMPFLPDSPSCKITQFTTP